MGVQLRPLPDDVLQHLKGISAEVLNDIAASDPMAQKVYDSMSTYTDQIRAYHAVTEQAYMNARD